MNVIFRTNCNGTMGHLARCRHLAVVLESLGFNTIFFLDSAPNFSVDWFEQLTWQAVYDTQVSGFLSEEQDASICSTRFKKHEPSLVIVDDYRLGETWEAEIQKLRCQMMAIDDLRRNHSVDILLEPRLVDNEDTRQHSETCHLLQSTRYTLLDPAYAQCPEERQSSNFTIVLSLGGGGDLQLLHECMRNLLIEFDTQVSHIVPVRLILKPVIGPMAINKALIHALADEYPSHVFPVENQHNLASYFREADLFVGAAGTSLYETAACDLPAITFSLSSNQLNKLEDLEPLGHYFHINEYSSENSFSLARLIRTVIDQYPRIQKLRSIRDTDIDGFGAQRVASLLQRRLMMNTSSVHEHDAALVNGVSNIEFSGGSAVKHSNTPAPQTAESLKPFAIRPCDDHDINRYLDARNLDANRDNMTNDKPINRLDHYHWWFCTQRHSYCAEQGGNAALYIWHEVVGSDALEVLVGGWFVASEQTDVACVMSALQWQLNLTDKEFPNLPWIAVIKKTNQFVYKMNERAGFKQAEVGGKYYQAIIEFFPEASPEEFFFVYRECSTDVSIVA